MKIMTDLKIMEVWVWQVEPLGNQQLAYKYEIRVVTRSTQTEKEIAYHRGHSSFDDLMKHFKELITHGRSKAIMSEFIAIHERPPWDLEIDVAGSVKCDPLGPADLARLRKEIGSI